MSEPHFEYTCDAGGCDEVTVAIIDTGSGNWLSMCIKHAQRDINKQWHRFLVDQMPKSVREHLTSTGL